MKSAYAMRTESAFKLSEVFCARDTLKADGDGFVALRSRVWGFWFRIVLCAPFAAGVLQLRGPEFRVLRGCMWMWCSTSVKIPMLIQISTP